MSDYFKRAHDNIAVEHPEFCRAWVQQSTATMPSPNGSDSSKAASPEVCEKKGEEGQALRERNRMNLVARITDYLGMGGFFNPESMEHCKVRDLLMDCRCALASAPAITDPLDKPSKHDCSMAIAAARLDEATNWHRFDKEHDDNSWCCKRENELRNEVMALEMNGQ